MTHRVIDIPGHSTRYEGGPIVKIVGPSDAPLDLIIRYHASDIHAVGGSKFGEIAFRSVLEYRWVASFVQYLSFEDHDDYTFGLIEILDSKLIEDMASKGARRKYPGKRFGDAIAEADVRHFRMAFDDYGFFDVVAFGVEIKQISDMSGN